MFYSVSTVKHFRIIFLALLAEDLGYLLVCILAVVPYGPGVLICAHFCNRVLWAWGACPPLVLFAPGPGLFFGPGPGLFFLHSPTHYL